MATQVLTAATKILPAEVLRELIAQTTHRDLKEYKLTLELDEHGNVKEPTIYFIAKYFKEQIPGKKSETLIKKLHMYLKPESIERLNKIKIAT